MNRTVYVFGNPDIPLDTLPILLVPDLEKKFPDIDFQVKDPHEEWAVPERLVIIDTVIGIDKVMVFHGLTQFQAVAHVSVHDFDAYANLRFLQKLGKLKDITIIGIPTGADKDAVSNDVGGILRKVF